MIVVRKSAERDRRLDTICEILRHHQITTQGELRDMLQERGFLSVSQASVARDLQDLGVKKIRGEKTSWYGWPREGYRNDTVISDHLDEVESLLSEALSAVQKMRFRVVEVGGEDGQVDGDDDVDTERQTN